MVDRILASSLAEGSISALNYAQKVLQIPQGLFATPLITVLYPSLAERNAVGDIEGFKERLARGLGALAFLAVPLLVGVVIFFRWLFGRLGGRYFLGETAKVTVAALVMGAVVWRLNVAAELPFVKAAQYAACFLGDGLARFAPWACGSVRGDVGTWPARARCKGSGDANGNIVERRAVLLDSEGCVVRAAGRVWPP